MNTKRFLSDVRLLRYLVNKVVYLKSCYFYLFCLLQTKLFCKYLGKYASLKSCFVFKRNITICIFHELRNQTNKHLGGFFIHPVSRQTPFRDLPDTFQTPSTHLLDTFQTPLIHIPDPSRHISETFRTHSRPVPDKFQTISGQIPDTLRTPCGHLADILQTHLSDLKDTFQKLSRHPPDTFKTP